MIKFQIFKLNFSRNMSKMHYFSSNFFKNVKHRFWCPKSSIFMSWNCVIWPNCSFSNWLWQNRIFKNQLWRHFSDIFVVNVTEERHQTKVKRFFNFGPLSIKIFGYASVSQHSALLSFPADN